ncbi:MAG: gamma-glutamyl-gamma-aminobutyrate hydrolase family protein, partial [Fimbriiglobus sp.]
MIGVVCYSLPAGERPAAQAVGRKYTAALRAVGGVPWLVPLAPDDPDLLDAIFGKLDGLCLTGGPDVSPAQYGEPAHPKLGPTDPDRDATEIAVVRLAVERG